MARATAAALVACLALAGCQDDGNQPTAEKSSASTASPSESATAKAPRATAKGPRATGPAIKGDVFTARAPQGFVKDKAYSTDFLDQFNGAEGTEAMYVGELDGEVRPLDEVAKGNFQGFATSGTKRRSTVGDFAGEPAYHFTADAGNGAFAEEFLTVHDGSQVTLGFVLTGTRAERQAVIDSVLASWEWT